MGVDQVRKRIRQIREKKGLRASDVAERIGLSRPFYTQLESGARGMSVCQLFRIARALGVSVGELCGAALEDEKLARMRGHMIPINDRRVWKILQPLLSESPGNVLEWEAILSQALEEMGKVR